MSRIDKWNPTTGTFRGKLNAALTATSGPAGVTDLNRILVVGMNGSGLIVKAASAITALGIIIATRPFAAGERIDVFTNAEVAELAAADLQSGSPAVGTHYYFDATASRLAAAAPGAGVNGFRVGWTVDDATRLVVRCGLVQG